MGRKTIHCVVGTKSGRPFAALVARGDDTTSSLDVIPLPPSETTDGGTDAVTAMHQALRAIGVDPERLADDGFEEPVLMLDELPEAVTFEELRRDWAMKLLAPSKS